LALKIAIPLLNSSTQNENLHAEIVAFLGENFSTKVKQSQRRRRACASTIKRAKQRQKVVFRHGSANFGQQRLRVLKKLQFSR